MWGMTAVPRYRRAVKERGVSMTIEELEQIEERAWAGEQINPDLILRLTSYLRDVLQQKANAEAIAEAAVKKTNLNLRYYSAGTDPHH